MKRSPSSNDSNRPVKKLLNSPGNHLHKLSTQLLGRLERQKAMRSSTGSPIRPVFTSPSNSKGETSIHECTPPRERSESAVHYEESKHECGVSPSPQGLNTPETAIKTARAMHNERNEKCLTSENQDLQNLCEKWFQASISVLNDIIGMPCILERISIFKSRLTSEDMFLSNMGLFLKLRDIDYDLVAWDEEAQEFGRREFSSDAGNRARMLGFYNDIRDIATSIFGLISDIERVPVRAIYPRYHVSEDD
jgi:hypothetical protein